jgi:hypothetical protein
LQKSEMDPSRFTDSTALSILNTSMFNVLIGTHASWPPGIVAIYSVA